MKVVWPCPWFGDYRVPVFTNLNKLLDNNFYLFYSRTTVTESVDRKMQANLPNNSEGLDEKIIIIGKQNKTTFANARLFIRYQPSLYKKLKQLNPDIVIAEAFGGWSIITIIYAIIHHKKIMMFYERTAYVERHAPWWRTLYRRIIGKAVQHFLINGNETRKYLDQLGFNKILSTQGLMVADTDGLAKDVINFNKNERNLLKNSLTLDNGLIYLFVGQIVERKGIKEMCSAWKEHLQYHPHDNLIIAGVGPLLDQYKENYKNILNMKFIGRVEYDNIYKYYAIADVFLMPTLEDNWCLVVPEAMACGLPIACSIYNGGHNELVKEGENGINFDPLNRDNFLNALHYFHSVDLETFGEKSKTIISNFTPEIAAKKIFNACNLVQNKSNK